MSYEVIVAGLAPIALNPGNEKTRGSAIRQLLDYLETTHSDLVDARIAISLHSKDEESRTTAISMLSIDFLESRDRRIGAVIARVVKDESASIDLRIFAYINLIDVSGRSTSEYPSLGAFQFPSDVDWNFVDQYVSAGQEKEEGHKGDGSN